MRIISGHARGRHLRSPSKDTSHVRPILARIKKSLFDILRLRVPESRFLDLYAGTGSVGLEALSRGATAAVFVEQDGKCAVLIQENLKHLNFSAQGTVVRISATGNLAILPGPFDVIFMGPPYKDENKKMLALTIPTLLNIEKHQLLKPSGLVIAQHHKTEPVAEPNEHWKMVRREKYGDSFLSFFEVR